MSYMDRKNILSEGFFYSLKNLLKLKKTMSKEKKIMRDPSFKKQMKKLDTAIKDSQDAIEKLRKSLEK